MRDEYTAIFRDLIRETTSSTGYTLPSDIEAYIAILLGDFLDKTQFMPDTSFAEAYLQLHKRQYAQAKELADVCLFLSGVFPDYGIGVDYYSSIGKSSYSKAAWGLNSVLFTTLSNNFDFLREFINLTTTQHRDRVISIRGT